VRKSSGKLSQQDVRDYFLATSLDEGLGPNRGGIGERHGDAHVTRDESARCLAAERTKGGINPLFTYLRWKGILERPLALVAVLILSPLLVVIAIVIRLDSPGKPIYCQERVGKSGHKFNFYKFRTMYTNNDDSEYRTYIRKYITDNTAYQVNENGQGVYKVINDLRITGFGAWLRKTNLDELPQIFNVLKGEMSFIGPRPEVSFALEMYSDWHWERLGVAPGITGLWQVSQRKNLSFDDMVRLDIDYVRRQSLLLDIKILLLTVKTVLRGDGS
jgi:lipopolysaccharide/colanic/teichoic acid biosynthesis glycosyltransferase